MNKFNPTALCASLALLSANLFAGVTPPAATPASLASEPAVSGLNGKIDGNYGAINESYTRGVAATISVPLGHSFGAQFDTLYQHGFESDIYGLGGHFFTRNPSKGLLGLAFGGLTSTDYTDALVGVEAEYYFDKITLGGFIGYNHYDTHVQSLFPVVLDETNFVAARLYAAIYPIDNLMIRLEYQNRFERNFYSANIEYQTPVRGLAVFVDGSVGDADYSHLMGGVRIYFGGDKSLKDRHRKDDPSNIASSFMPTGSAASGQIAEPTAVPFKQQSRP